MKILEITALSNGAHRNQSGNFRTVPDGWAIIPENMICENFPFGVVEAEEVNGIMTVTKWTAGETPEPEPEPTPEPTAEERISELEAQLAESDEAAIALYEAQAQQEAINAEQDEAILGIYEMIGG